MNKQFKINFKNFEMKWKVMKIRRVVDVVLRWTTNRRQLLKWTKYKRTYMVTEHKLFNSCLTLALINKFDQYEFKTSYKVEEKMLPVSTECFTSQWKDINIGSKNFAMEMRILKMRVCRHPSVTYYEKLRDCRTKSVENPKSLTNRCYTSRGGG